MITKRIIPCLDVRDGQVVKGPHFQGLPDASSPVALAEHYSSCGADELAFFDITASSEGRPIRTEMLTELASRIFIPLTVGGGIRTTADFDRVLKCGADKVSVNTGALQNPRLILEAAQKYGNQCVVLSVDVKRENGRFMVRADGGKEPTGLEAISWIKKCVDLGAGELVINSVDADDGSGGFDLELLQLVCDTVSVPVVASGGATRAEDFLELFRKVPQVDAGLAAMAFHFGPVQIPSLKESLHRGGISVRI